MHLRSPRDQLADCVWLPRILAKARLLKAGKLAPDYAARFGHASGVDGQFLAFFRLTTEDILAVCELGPPAITGWFLQRLPVQPEHGSPIAKNTSESDLAFRSLYTSAPQQIAAWNHLAVNLGREGFPMAERLPIALSTTYQHLQGRPLATVFEVLEADEQPA